MTATIEQVKKFWDDRPCNVRHSDKEVGTLDYFKEVTKKSSLSNHILRLSPISDDGMVRRFWRLDVVWPLLV